MPTTRRSTRKPTVEEVAPATPSSSKKLTKNEKSEARHRAKESQMVKKPPVADEEPEVPVKPKQPRKRKDAPTKKAAPKQAAKKSKAAPTPKKSEIARQDVPAEDVVEAKPRKRTPAKPATAKTPTTASTKKSHLSPVPENEAKESKTIMVVLDPAVAEDFDLSDDDDEDSPPGLQPSKHNNEDDDDDDDKSKASASSFTSARSTATTSTTTSRRTTAKKGKKNEWGHRQRRKLQELCDEGTIDPSMLDDRNRIQDLKEDYKEFWGQKHSEDYDLFKKNLNTFFSKFYKPKAHSPDRKPRAVDTRPRTNNFGDAAHSNNDDEDAPFVFAHGPYVFGTTNTTPVKEMTLEEQLEKARRDTEKKSRTAEKKKKLQDFYHDKAGDLKRTLTLTAEQGLEHARAATIESEAGKVDAEARKIAAQTAALREANAAERENNNKNIPDKMMAVVDKEASYYEATLDAEEEALEAQEHQARLEALKKAEDKANKKTWW